MKRGISARLSSYLVAGMLLVTQVSQAWLSVREPSALKYQDIALTEENSPEVTAVSTATVEVKWFYGTFVETYSHDDPVPEGNILLRDHVIEEPTYAEETQEFYVSNLIGITLTGIHQVWISVRAGEQTEVMLLNVVVEEGAPPVEIANGWAEGWTVTEAGPPDGVVDAIGLIKWNKIFPGYIRGTDFSLGYTNPYLDVKVGSPWTIAFYKGEVGDTTNFIYSVADYEASPMGGGIVWFQNYIQSDSTYVWARVTKGEDHYDSTKVLLKTIEPEDVELIDWPDTIKSADVGSDIILKPEFNVFMSGAMQAEVFWGETGDTSDLALIIGSQSIPELKIEVPANPTYVWTRFKFGDLTLDTPSTLISPLPKSAPQVIDQPNDIIYEVGAPRWMVGGSIGVIGGNLQFIWFAGQPGDLTTPLASSTNPNSYGNVRSMTVTIPEGVQSIYVLIWNELGTLATRTVHLKESGFSDFRVLNIPLQVRIREKDLLQREIAGGYFDFIWAKTWMGYPNVTLMAERDGQFVDVFTNDFAGGGPDNARRYFHFSDTSDWTVAASLPSGSYKYRFFNNGEFRDSEPFTIINELIDGTKLEVAPAAYPISPAGSFTNGGVFKARVALTEFIRWDTQRVYAGPIGDRSNPVEFDSSYSRIYYDLYNGQDFGQYDFTLTWPSTGNSMYWFEAEAHSGGVVRSILRYPDLGNNSSANNGHVTNILIPPGSDIIPIPNLDTLPNVSSWKFGQQDSHGSKINLPLQLSDLQRPDMGVTLWGQDSEVVELMDIRVDQNIPPQILQTSEYAAVLPNGRVMWTAPVNGDVTQTVSFFGIEDGPWQLLEETYGKVTQGFVVPEMATKLKTVYKMDQLESETSYSLSRIPEEFLLNAEVAFTEENTFVTERMGTFLEAQYYPSLRHAELGWMEVYPYADGLIFLGDTARGRTDWNWIHPDFFPCIFNFGTKSWRYYWINGYGWFWDYEKSEWFNLGS